MLENQNAPDAASSKSAPREGLLHDFSEQENPAHEFWFQKKEAKEVFKCFFRNIYVEQFFDGLAMFYRLLAASAVARAERKYPVSSRVSI